MINRALHLLALFTLVFSFVLAVPRLAAADDDDPPARVARLSYTNGQVSFNPAGTDDWVSSVVNRPITTGDKLWTDKEARAELHIGSAAIRLAGETGFSFLNLDDRVMQIRLTEGIIELRVRRLAQDESMEVDTPNLALSILRPGRYRISVNENGDNTIVSVFDGEGEVTGGGSAYTVHPGEQGFFTGTDTLNSETQPLPDEDDFDHWCNGRDLREDHAVARRYVSDDVIGYEDLDENGGWRSVPEYGTVWFPHVAVVGWAPYRFGHWAWVSPWGWTWIDNASWGFAPFHYGRWIFAGGGWGWVPCPPPVVAVAYVRPVYSPALVAWVGGPHFAAGIAFGGGVAVGVNVGWFPLGPREVFVPSYHVSRAYINNVNISNTTVNQTVINNYYNNTVVNKNVTVNNNVHYMNQGVPGAVTATSHESFTSAQPVARNLVSVNQKEIASAPVAASAPAIVPPKQAVLGAGKATNLHPPMNVQNRAVVAKTAPPPPPPSFQQRQAAIQANQGRPISQTQARQLQPEHSVSSAPAVKIAPAASPRANTMQTGGNHTNDPGPLNANRLPNTQGGQVNQGTPHGQPGQGNPNTPANTRSSSDRPPAVRQNSNANPQLEEKHQQQLQQLQQKQDQEYQKLQQKQQQQAQKLQQQNADAERQRQAQQQQQEKLQQLEQKHNQQQQVLEHKQTAEHAKTPPAPKPKSDEKDKPHR